MSQVGDFFWAHADILRDLQVDVSKRVLGLIALKLLVDNKKLKFNFNYKDNFGLDKDFFTQKDNTTQKKFLKIINNLEKFSNTSNKFGKDIFKNLFEQGFNIKEGVNEISNSDFEKVLDVYIEKANFINYPKEEYKDLYEMTLTRLEEKKYKGDLLGQHFTQKSIIHLMCEMAIPSIKDREKIAIYDPSCGNGSMLMESFYYFQNHSKTKTKSIEVYGQEIDKRGYVLCNIFLEISEIDYNIVLGNTLLNPAFINGINGDDSFDFIIANPPFGLDWKHNYDEEVELMKQDKNFLIVKNEKDKIVTPKKSDGQFLFIQHILKLLINEQNKTKKKDGFAGIISSSTLISTGNNNSSEAKIREKIFNLGYLKAVIEQPKAMFSNTDITSHIWFFDTTYKENYIKILQVDNEEKNIFIPHSSPKKKMKNSYSKENIKEIVRKLNNKKATKYVTKNLNLKDKVEINISNEIDKKPKFIDVNIEKSAENLKIVGKDICEILKLELW